MRKFVERLSSVLDRVAAVSLWIAAAGLVSMTALIFWQVYGRFVLNDTPTWTETTSILLMGWFLLLGAAAGIREGNHLSFDVLLIFVSDRARRVLFSISDVVVLAFGLGNGGLRHTACRKDMAEHNSQSWHFRRHCISRINLRWSACGALFH